jgi:hypothetical protein
MTTAGSDFVLNRPGALIAALPAVLGFVPEKSLIVVSIGDGELGAVLRVDLSPELTDRVGQLAEVAAAAHPQAAVAVIVDADGAACPVCDEEYRQLCASLCEELSQRDIALWAAHVVDRVAPGGHWHCVDGCGAAGAVDDPSASPLAMVAVLDGRRLYPRRADLQAVIAVDEGADSTELAAALEHRATAREAAHRADPDGSCRRDVENAMAAAARVADGQPLGNAELAALGCALADLQVRDTLYALAVGENAAEARVVVGAAGPQAAPAVAGGGAGAVGVQRICPRRRAAGRSVVGGGAVLRARPPDGRHAGHGVAVGPAARVHPRACGHRLPTGQAAGRAPAAATDVRSARGVAGPVTAIALRAPHRRRALARPFPP